MWCWGTLKVLHLLFGVGVAAKRSDKFNNSYRGARLATIAKVLMAGHWSRRFGITMTDAVHCKQWAHLDLLPA